MKLEPWLKPRPKPKPRARAGGLERPRRRVDAGRGHAGARQHDRGRPARPGGRGRRRPLVPARVRRRQAADHARRAARGGGRPDARSGWSRGSTWRSTRRSTAGRGRRSSGGGRPAACSRPTSASSSRVRSPTSTACGSAGPLARGPRRADRAPRRRGLRPTPRPSKARFSGRVRALGARPQVQPVGGQENGARRFEGVRRFTAVQLTATGPRRSGATHYIGDGSTAGRMREPKGTVARARRRRRRISRRTRSGST